MERTYGDLIRNVKKLYEPSRFEISLQFFAIRFSFRPTICPQIKKPTNFLLEIFELDNSGSSSI